MSQQSPYLSGDNPFPFPLSAHSSNTNATPRSSGMDARHRTTDVDTLNPHFFGEASNAASELFADLDLPDLSSVQKAMPPPDNRSGLAGREISDRLLQFYCDRDGPWNQEKSRVRGQAQAPPPSFTGFRETVAPSECETSVGPGTLRSDSGYGSQARQSVGIPSVFGDVDRSPESLLTQLTDFQIPPGPSHSSSFVGFQPPVTNHFRHAWATAPRSLDRRDTLPANNTPNYVCQYCQQTNRSQSDHKKHIARHEKPHKCPTLGCAKAVKGFSTANDLDRHMVSVHRKEGIRYRCHHGSCAHKDKDYPRADNFRQHLKKIHSILLSSEESLDEYIQRPSNPEILSNVGVAPELIPPPVHASAALPSWSQLEQDTRTYTSATGAGKELRPSSHDYVPPPMCPHHRNTLGTQRTHERELFKDGNALFAVYPAQEGKHGPREKGHQDTRPYHGMLSGGSSGFVRPDDLRSRAPAVADPARPSTEPDEAAILLGGDNEDAVEDEGIGASEEVDNRDDRYHESVPRSPASVPKPPHRRDELGRSLIEDMVEQNKRLAGIPTNRDLTSAREDPIKLGASPASVPARTSPSGDVGDRTSKEAEARFAELIEQLPGDRLDSLLRPRGYVKPKEQQAKPKKTGFSSSQPLQCQQPGCNKTFNRQCELKKHLKRHEKPYGCTQCSSRFGSKNDWKRHENSQHFQYEIWKCDERLKAPLSDACNKVCHRPETLRQHLITHHNYHHDSQRLEDKVGKCHMRLGEVQFWCGFCRAIIELKTEGMSPQDVCNGRYDHIDDHYSGRNGMERRSASEWLSGDLEAPEGDVESVAGSEKRKVEQVPPSGAGPGPGPGLGGPRKRKGDASTRATKRTKTSPPGENIVSMWYCCQCNNAWNVSNVPSCISCPAHVRCKDCLLEYVRAKDD